MTYEASEHRKFKGQWVVETFGDDGECYQALFSGPGAEDRAREYVAFKNQQ